MFFQCGRHASNRYCYFSWPAGICPSICLSLLFYFAYRSFSINWFFDIFVCTIFFSIALRLDQATTVLSPFIATWEWTQVRGQVFISITPKRMLMFLFGPSTTQLAFLHLSSKGFIGKQACERSFRNRVLHLYCILFQNNVMPILC